MSDLLTLIFYLFFKMVCTGLRSFMAYHLRGAVVRAEAQGSGDPCILGSNPTVGHDMGAGPSDETI
jgi:hypothetical protein